MLAVKKEIKIQGNENKESHSIRTFFLHFIILSEKYPIDGDPKSIPILTNISMNPDVAFDRL